MTTAQEYRRATELPRAVLRDPLATDTERQEAQAAIDAAQEARDGTLAKYQPAFRRITAARQPGP